MIKKRGDVFQDLAAEKVVYEALKDEAREFAKKMKEKYVPKFKKLKQIRDEQVGFKIFEVNNLIWEYILQDPDLAEASEKVRHMPLVTRKMVKQVFKDCINEILDEITVVDVNGEKTNPKTNRMLLAEKLVRDTLNGTIEPNVLKGFEVIRDTIGEKPANEVISKGIQQKVIDINITKEKVDKVKNILEGLRSARLTDGFEQDITLGTSDARPRDEGVVEVDVSGQPEGVHNADILPDKQD